MNDQQLREEICEIGARLYNRGYAAANDGNISCRIGENEVLCTPTLISKGFMKPEDLCVVDLEGNQLRGQRKRTSEILLHLSVYRSRDDVRSVVHCHPPHATAFAIAGEPIPQGIHPEAEFFLGNVGFTKYETPGTAAFADSVLPFVEKTNTIVLASHGTVSYDDSVERAFWWTDVLDSYCRVLILAKQLGGVQRLPDEKVAELIDAKAAWGMSDARLTDGVDDLAGNAVFQSELEAAGVVPRAFPRTKKG
ncbi:MAG: class II aldolase/adducin family protein [Planctomycetota bacterium]